MGVLKVFEQFEEATLEVVSFETADVITTSGNDMGDLEQEL